MATQSGVGNVVYGPDGRVLSTMPDNVLRTLPLISPGARPITQEQVNLWMANIQARPAGDGDLLDWIRANPYMALGIGAVALLLLMPRGRR